MHLKEFRASERVSGHDQELLVQYQTEFFSDYTKVTVNKKGKKRRKVVKCPWAVEGQRVSAWHHIKALDKQVFLTLGIGLSFFQGTEHDWMTVALQFLYMNIIPPTMTLHLDEGSPAYSMTWYLMYHEDMRMIAQRDIFHRQWNDVKGATSGSDLWYVVLLMTVVFNLPFGPWEGGTWFR